MTGWDEIRRDFPATARGVFLNAAAGSPVPRPVSEAVSTYLREAGEDDRWRPWLERQERAREAVAGLVGADADEIAFVTNTSAGMNLIADLLAGDGAVLSDELEFPTVTLPWIHRGVAVHFVPAVEGVLHLESFALADAPKAATICVSHVQFSNGCRQDLDAFGALKQHRRLVVCGSQSVGAFPVDVRRSGIDALASAGYKWLCAGYGTGFVYVSRELLERPPRSIGWRSVERPLEYNNREYTLLASARRYEMGCPAFASALALGAAVQYVTGIGVEAIAQRVLELNAYLTGRLEHEGFTVLSPGGAHRSGETLVQLADPRSACHALLERGIHVTRKPEGVRVSTHFYNNEEDVDRCVQALREHAATA
ncbi:MAG TPA: aminotransferase class V-fold PLP-dependent enzyme [Vicinamibacteria bacterium]|nr:aminotransferase class V-fold PLP-dependent enzyme [Vicinamibacteria bacterium]